MRGDFETVFAAQIKKFSPEALRLKHIEFSRNLLRAKQKEGVTEYQIFTDDIPATSESQVKQFGKIKYVFLNMGQIARFAKSTAERISPVRSGNYQHSWIVMVDNTQVDPNHIPGGTRELTLVNFQPYARKIHLRGARLLGVPPGIVERVRLYVMRRFSSVTASITYIHLPGGHVRQRDVYNRLGKRRLASGNTVQHPALVIRWR